MKKEIEILAPAGNPESFWTAIKAGANAVYLGLDGFNARSRAKNFRIDELIDIIEMARKNNVKVYITVNILIKNNELSKLVNFIYKVVSAKPDALIIQDLGLFYLLKKMNYPHIHFSTQAAIHNSIGVRYAKMMGAERSILARELTLSEIAACAKEGEIEIFVHGALCYSLSGNCLFSSYLGGMSANRGKCKQPCRRLFNLSKRKKRHLFSMKDLELVNYLPQLINAGVSSLKIEGRMKRSEYVDTVVSSYKSVLDGDITASEAREILKSDFGRLKTSYFMGDLVKDSISEFPYAGIYLGNGEVIDNKIILKQNAECSSGDKIKIYLNESDSDSFTVVDAKDNEIIISDKIKRTQNIDVYKVSNVTTKIKNIKFKKQYITDIPKKLVSKYINIKQNEPHHKEMIYFRVKSYNDIKKIIKTGSQHKYILSIDNLKTNDYARNDLIIELPLFIAEKELDNYRNMIKKLVDKGFINYSISHISQQLLLPKGVNIMANEYVYTLNDLSIKQLRLLKIENFVVSIENDIPNLSNYKDKTGIVPVFFTPALFSSRMPVKEAKIKDKLNSYLVSRKGRLTCVYPEKPVCIFGFLKKIDSYKKFLIDLSTPNLNETDFDKIITAFINRKNLDNTSKFNFKKGLW